MDPNTSTIETLDGTLSTPSATVHVASVAHPIFLMVDQEELAPGKDEQFVVADVTITQFDDMTVTPSYAIEYDGQPAGDAAAEALKVLVRGSSTQIALSVPTDVEDVTLVVTTGDVPQAISLLTGDVKDNGESDRLGTAVSGVSSATYTEPEILDETGELTTKYDSWYADYSKSVDWTITPWLASQGWAPSGDNHFVLDLAPVSPEAALPLTVEDATVTINGMQYAPVSYSPAEYAFTFLIPENVDRINAELRVTIDTAQLSADAWSHAWEPGWTVSPGEIGRAHV